MKLPFRLLCPIADTRFYAASGGRLPCGSRGPELLLGSLRTLCTVLGTALQAVCDALSIQGTADDVVTHTREVTYTAATDQDNRVLLNHGDGA